MANSEAPTASGLRSSPPWLKCLSLTAYQFNRPGSGASTNVARSLASYEFRSGVYEAWIRHYESARVPSRDIAEDIAVDQAGNIYLTGAIEGAYTYVDYVTIKYDRTGRKLWTVYHNDNANDFDSPVAIAVDPLGNVYVTGISRSNNGFDWCTIKYNVQGVEQWVARYNGSANADDHPADIVVDSAGNLYVTGLAQYAESAADIVTIKYNAFGKEEWIARYNGRANMDDWGVGLEVDAAGNVYIAGSSSNSQSDHDVVVIKYNNGMAQWVRSYSSSANSLDDASAIARDAFGNVYVTGSTSDTETKSDCITIKYNADGDELWAARYSSNGNFDDHPASILADRANNIYVAGWSIGETTKSDYLTIKYDSEGSEQWVVRYDGLNNADDYANCLAADQRGNVYVSGTSGNWPWEDVVTIKYNAQGREQWIANYNGPGDELDYPSAIASDVNGNVYVAGASEGIGTSQDMVIIKYDPAGAVHWYDRFDGPRRSQDWGRAMAIDDSENVYLAGSSYGPDFSGDIVAMKFNTSGAMQWTGRYDAMEDYDAVPNVMALDAAGNVYIAGSIEGSTTVEDFITVKFDRAGNVAWTARYNGEANGRDIVTSIAVSKTGNAYITGISRGIDSGTDWVTIKYDPLGAEQWIRRYNGPGNGNDQAVAIGLDENENVYVAGAIWGEGNTRYDYAVMKYSSQGDQIFAVRYNNSANDGFDKPAALAVDRQGNFCVTGNSEGVWPTGIDYLTIKYDSTGKRQWLQRYSSIKTYARDFPTAIILDNFGNVIVTGETGSSSDHYQRDFTTVKYSPAGRLLWASSFMGAADADDRPLAVAADSSGNVYVTGYSDESGFDNDIITIKYDADGKQAWLARYGYSEHTYDMPASIAVGRSGDVYVGGYSAAHYWSICTAIKYGQTSVSSGEGLTLRQDSFQLHQNYPNPFNTVTRIGYYLPQAADVQVTIFDLRGRKVATLVQGHQMSGRYDITWNAEDFPSGTYFCRLEAGDCRQTKKLVLLR